MTKNKCLIIILAICMIFAYLPVNAYATESLPEGNENIQEEQSQAEETQNSEIEGTEDSDTSKTEEIQKTESVQTEKSETEETNSSTEAEYDEKTELALKRVEDLSDAGIDFASKRLIVKGLKKELKGEPVIASLDGVYLLQYDDYMDAIDAYYRLSEISDSVEFDSPMEIASPEVGISAFGEEEVEPMTKKDNPFAESDEINLGDEGYDIAVIDTGANNVEKTVSVIGDDGKDRHGHGQAMIDTIKSYTPDCSILSIKAIGDDGVGDVSAVYSAIRLAIDERVSIINLSISAYATEDNFIIEEIIKEAESKGITVVGAAGNNGDDASLTIPGRIKEATIVGTTKKSSNKGDTVDYYVPVSSTSMATAVVTGILVSDSLNDYEIENKVIKLENRTEDDSSVTDPSEDFTVQDDSGGGAGGGGAGSASGGVWSDTKTNRTFVWFDKGGFVDEGEGAENGKYPAQGYYQRSDGKWYDNHGQNPMTTLENFKTNEYTKGFYTYKFFMDRLTEKVQSKYGSAYHYDYLRHGYLAGKNDKIIRQYMEEACQRALSRNSKAKTARVIGVAVTYRKGTFKNGGGTTWKNVWVLMRSKGDKTYVGMFGGAGRLPTTSELDAPGWITRVSPSHNSPYAGMYWYEYAYYTGRDDNKGFKADTNKLGDRFFVVAVADNEPPSTVTVQINKSWDNTSVTQSNNLYSLNGTVFKLYSSAADAKANTNAKATFTTDASGKTNTQDVNPGIYYLVEIGPPQAGRTIPTPLKAENGGKLVNVVANTVIDVSDTPLTGNYMAKYRYVMDGGTLPSEVMDTLPASVTRPNGDLVVASIPANTRITVGENTYVFLGWDAPQRVINGADITFVGTWSLETDPEGDADDDGYSDDGRIVIYKYQIIDDLG